MKDQFRTDAELGNDGVNIDFFDFASIMLHPSFISDPAHSADTWIPAATSSTMHEDR